MVPATQRLQSTPKLVEVEVATQSSTPTPLHPAVATLILLEPEALALRAPAATVATPTLSTALPCSPKAVPKAAVTPPVAVVHQEVESAIPNIQVELVPPGQHPPQPAAQEVVPPEQMVTAQQVQVQLEVPLVPTEVQVPHLLQLPSKTDVGVNLLEVEVQVVICPTPPTTVVALEDQGWLRLAILLPTMLQPSWE